MKLAYFVYPHLGGTFTVFRHLRSGLAISGIEVEWIGIGRAAHSASRDPAWQSEWGTGHACGEADDDEPSQARALFAYLLEQKFDGVLVSVHADRVQTNLARYLPTKLLRVMIAHNITPATYAAARTIRDHVHATIGVSRRIRDDLIEEYGFNPATTHAIHNAVDCPAPPSRAPRNPGDPLRLLSLGRIEDQAKGVLWLPEILRKLPQDVTLTVAGDGPDLARLRQRSASLGHRICFLGAVAPSEAVALMAEHDVLIAPSRFEGFMITLAEAMAAGCVPVVSRIRGVTDTVVDDGVTGQLFPVGDVAAAAAAINHIRQDPAHWHSMSCHGPIAMRERFSIARMAAGYAARINELRDGPPPIAPALAMQDWHMPRGLRDGFRSRLPTPLKNLLRNIRERAA